MSRRLALTPAIGLFTGLSMVSFGAMGMFLTGAHGSSQATNACSAKATAVRASAATHAGTAHSGAMYVGATHVPPATHAPAATHLPALFAPAAAHITATHIPAVTYAPAATHPTALSAPAAAHVIAAHTTAFEARSWRSGSGAAARAAARPVLLDVAARGIPAGQAARHSPGQAAQRHSAGQAAQRHSADTAGTTAQTSPPVSSPGPSNPPPPTPDPSPGGNVTPSPSSSTPTPGSTGNDTPVKHSPPTPPVSPGGGEKTPKSSATPTPTPTPTSTATTPPPAATLCVSVQTLGGSSTVKPDRTVQFAIWVWLTSGNGGTATIGVDASPSRVKPTFSVCQPTGGAACSVSGLKAGHHVEAEAELKAAKDLAGRDITLTVTATSHQASNKASATDKIKVESKSSHKKHSSSPSPTPTPNAGDGGNLSPGSYSGGTGSYSGVSNPAGNLGSDFPQVSPSPNLSPTTPRNHDQHQVQVTDLSAALPLDVRLIGGQVIGLAILAAAVTIAVARLSLRRQPPRHGDDSAGS
jgi:hypothetical protein